MVRLPARVATDAERSASAPFAAGAFCTAAQLVPEPIMACRVSTFLVALWTLSGVCFTVVFGLLMRGSLFLSFSVFSLVTASTRGHRLIPRSRSRGDPCRRPDRPAPAWLIALSC